MKKTRLIYITGILVSICILVGISVVYPSIDDLWVENPFWNGLSKVYVTLQPTRMQEYTLLDVLLDPKNSTLFIIGPSKEFTVSEVESITFYIAKGGLLVLADDFGTGNQLLESLGLSSRFEGGLLYDPVFHYKNSLMPIIVTSNQSTVSSVVLNFATTLDVEEQYVVLRSSPLSYTVDEMDSNPTEFVSYPIMARVGLPDLDGTIVLISDSSLFINSMIDRGDNLALLDSLTRGNTIIDEAHSTQSLLSRFKFVLANTYTVLNYYEIRYGLCIIGMAMIMWLKLKVEEPPIDEIERVLGKHPEYNRDQLIWLQNERRKANVKL